MTRVMLVANVVKAAERQAAARVPVTVART
jgi:hypothetical protein